MAPNGIALAAEAGRPQPTETDMKTAIAVLLSGCAIFGAAPAFAPAFADGGISLAKGVKLCNAQFEQLTPALKSYTVDYEDSRSSETHFKLAFKATNAEGRLDKFTCTVDRKERKAAIALKKRRMGSFPAPEFAGDQRLALKD
jgi:hypothetical protein